MALHAAQDRWPRAAIDTPGAALRALARGRERVPSSTTTRVAADLYWIRALQHFGKSGSRRRATSRTYALLYPLLDLTTTLDPYFSIAYRFGAIFLGEPYPGGPGRPDLAIALLQKGLAAQPAKWQYMMDLGFVYYWHLRDYKSAAAGVPARVGDAGCAELAAAARRGDAGRRRTPRRVAGAVAAAGAVRRAVAARLRRAAPRAARRDGRHRGLETRESDQGLNPPIPGDPSGTPFVLDPATGGITVARESKLFPLPGQLQAPR